ncbi:hypothetical protein BKA63DRAFT_571202 [Paraphoma chrysanthemicola]|nr:hypothetical protein BKA63DRAFT_571202 [Paraphoma chrysanthemicola]
MEPDLVLYDLACTKNICFSPVVWRIRLMLNYKGVPYRTVFLEFPDIEPTLKKLGLAPAASGPHYTVPSIHHLSSNTYLMGSEPIADFLESTYPDPTLPLTSELGHEIGTRARSVIGPVLGRLIMPRELSILSSRSQEYFRRTREATLGHKLEDLLDPEQEEKAWTRVHDDISAIGELMLTNKAKGPFVLGASPSGTDFFIAGFLQSVRTVDQEVFLKMTSYPGHGDIYTACLPYMEKKD